MADIRSENKWYLWTDDIQWRSMESAPKDATVVLLNHDGIYPCVGWYDKSKNMWQEVWQHDWKYPNQPNGWMPCPKPLVDDR